jgi:hypothetical protein
MKVGFLVNRKNLDSLIDGSFFYTIDYALLIDNSTVYVNLENVSDKHFIDIIRKVKDILNLRYKKLPRIKFIQNFEFEKVDILFVTYDWYIFNYIDIFDYKKIYFFIPQEVNFLINYVKGGKFRYIMNNITGIIVDKVEYNMYENFFKKYFKNIFVHLYSINFEVMKTPQSFNKQIYLINSNFVNRFLGYEHLIKDFIKDKEVITYGFNTFDLFHIKPIDIIKKYIFNYFSDYIYINFRYEAENRLIPECINFGKNIIIPPFIQKEDPAMYRYNHLKELKYLDLNKNKNSFLKIIE